MTSFARASIVAYAFRIVPTYQVRRDENDSPRGRIVLMRNMYEQGGQPDKDTVKHLDRCLNCLACEAICPSGVKYSKLIEHGLQHVEATYRRPLFDRIIRWALTGSDPQPLVVSSRPVCRETGSTDQALFFRHAKGNARHDAKGPPTGG